MGYINSPSPVKVKSLFLEGVRISEGARTGVHSEIFERVRIPFLFWVLVWGLEGYRYEFFRGCPEGGFRGSERGVWISEIFGVLPRGLYCFRYEIRHDFLEKPGYRNRELGRISYRGIREFNGGY